eukprot:scaffold140_cov565-Prasinococcus_capsulatus_cf.AAC.22
MCRSRSGRRRLSPALDLRRPSHPLGSHGLGDSQPSVPRARAPSVSIPDCARCVTRASFRGSHQAADGRLAPILVVRGTSPAGVVIVMRYCHRNPSQAQAGAKIP